MEAQLSSPMPAQRATEVPCERCGTFLEPADLRTDRLCRPCAERLETEAIDFKDLLGATARLTLRCAPYTMLTLPILVLTSCSSLFAKAPALIELVGLLATVALVLLYPGMMYGLGFSILQGERVALVPTLRLARRRCLALVTTSFANGVLIWFFALFLIVPGVQRYLSHLVAAPIALFENDSGLSALRTSARRMDGVRWTTLFASLVLFLPAGLYHGVAYGLVYFGAADGLATHGWVLYGMAVAVGVLHLLVALPTTMLSVVLYQRTLGRALI